MAFRLASAAPAFAFDDDLNVVAWNLAAAELTGIPTEDALGRQCWDVMGGRDDAGGIVCHIGCSRARLAREGWPLEEQVMHVRCESGRRRVAVNTVAALDSQRPLYIHVLRDAPASSPPREQTIASCAAPELTPRQTEVLRLLGSAASTKSIASTLHLSESTVRNHIRALLLALDAHSQLEAVVRARELGLL